MSYGPSSILGEVLRNPRAAAVVHKHLPGLENAPTRVQFMYGTLQQVAGFMEGIRNDRAAWKALFAELATVVEDAPNPPNAWSTACGPCPSGPGSAAPCRCN